MLPLDHVIRVLEEVRQMVLDAGREIQRDKGLERISTEFGLEVLTSERGILFKGGSVEAQIAVTANTQTGILAAKRIVQTVNDLTRKKYTPVTEADRSIVRRLNRITRIQRIDRTELQIAVIPAAGKRMTAKQATFGDAAAEAAWSIQAPVFQMEHMVLYGKLYELKDADSEDEDRGFWGELHRESGELWRIQFRAKDADKAAGLFRKQVTVTGTAKYYRIAAPKLVADDIVADKERDYESAFDELYGCDNEVSGKEGLKN
jgi:hypothetical protein